MASCLRGFPINTYRCLFVCAVSGVDELVAGRGVEGGGGTTGTTCAVLPCKKALPRGSPVTVKTAVALQLESKTGALAVAAVGVVVFGVRFFAGASEAFTGVLVLLLFVLVVKAHGDQGNQSRISGAARSSYAIRRSVPGHSSPRASVHKAQSKQLQYPLQYGHANISAKRSNSQLGKPARPSISVKKSWAASDVPFHTQSRLRRLFR